VGPFPVAESGSQFPLFPLWAKRSFPFSRPGLEPNIGPLRGDQLLGAPFLPTRPYEGLESFPLLSPGSFADSLPLLFFFTVRREMDLPFFPSSGSTFFPQPESMQPPSFRGANPTLFFSSCRKKGGGLDFPPRCARPSSLVLEGSDLFFFLISVTKWVQLFSSPNQFLRRSPKGALVTPSLPN